jgi:stress response protein SCP2
MSATLTQGGNTPLPHGQLTVKVQHGSSVLTDLVALLLNGEGKVRSDDDLVFFNNPVGDGVQWSQPSYLGDDQIHQITVDPSRWSADSGINKLVIALTIDESESASPGKKFGDVQNLQAEIRDAGGNVVTLDLGRPTKETGFLVAEIYLHNGAPKVRCVAQGYETGLTGILNDHGIEVEEQSEVQDAQPGVQVTKPKLGSGAVYDLTKPTNGSLIDMRKHQVAVVLVKHKIDGIKARVVLSIDSSGSMEFKKLFSKGVVQRSLEQVVPIADMLDDNHEMEVWFFGTDSVQSETVNLENMYDYIPRNWQDKLDAGWDNEEQKVMQDIIDWVKENPSEYPTLVLFWSDGGIYRNAEIERLIRDSLELPIFWMFLGLGRSNYGILRKLDQLEGRFIGEVEVDNTGFEEIDDIESKEDFWLYDIIIFNMAKWVREMIAARKLDEAGRVVM